MLTAHPTTGSSRLRRLGKFFVALLVIGLVVGASVLVSNKLRQQQVARQLQAQGAYVRFEYDGPPWLASPLWQYFSLFDRIDLVDLKGHSIPTETLSGLAQLTDVVNFYADKSPVKDEGVAGLRRMSDLQILYLTSTQLTGGGLVYFRSSRFFVGEFMFRSGAGVAVFR